MLEPAITPLGWLVYGLLHQEPVVMGAGAAVAPVLRLEAVLAPPLGPLMAFGQLAVPGRRPTSDDHGLAVPGAYDTIFSDLPREAIISVVRPRGSWPCSLP